MAALVLEGLSNHRDIADPRRATESRSACANQACSATEAREGSCGQAEAKAESSACRDSYSSQEAETEAKAESAGTALALHSNVSPMRYCVQDRGCTQEGVLCTMLEAQELPEEAGQEESLQAQASAAGLLQDLREELYSHTSSDGVLLGQVSQQATDKSAQGRACGAPAAAVAGWREEAHHGRVPALQEELRAEHDQACAVHAQVSQGVAARAVLCRTKQDTGRPDAEGVCTLPADLQDDDCI